MMNDLNQPDPELNTNRVDQKSALLSEDIEQDGATKPRQPNEGRAKGLFFLVLIIAGIIVGFRWYSGSTNNTPSTVVEVTILSARVNGQLYEKEAVPRDLNSDFVTFSDGTRVPWSQVKATKRYSSKREAKTSKIFPVKMGNPPNLSNAALPASRSDAPMVAVGFSPRKSAPPAPRRVATLEMLPPHRASLRDAAQFSTPIRGLKPTATFTLSLRDEELSCDVMLRPCRALSPIAP